MKAIGMVALALLAMAGEAVAEAPACEANYKQEGSFFAGRRFTTWAELPAVSTDVAFKRVYTEMVKSGLKVASSDKEMGLINGEQSQTLNGAQVTLPWNVAIEQRGKGAKITVSKMTPGGYATGKEYQIRSMCYIVDTAAGKN